MGYSAVGGIGGFGDGDFDPAGFFLNIVECQGIAAGLNACNNAASKLASPWDLLAKGGCSSAAYYLNGQLCKSANVPASGGGGGNAWDALTNATKAGASGKAVNPLLTDRTRRFFTSTAAPATSADGKPLMTTTMKAGIGIGVAAVLAALLL